MPVCRCGILEEKEKEKEKKADFSIFFPEFYSSYKATTTSAAVSYVHVTLP